MSIDSVSVIDGRYERHVSHLANYTSESALIRYRVQVEIEWFLHLHAACPQVTQTEISNADQENLRNIYREFDADEANRVVELERQTNHDVKAVEYYIRDKIKLSGLNLNIELVHFCCTSEDINNLAYALMLVQLRNGLLLPQMYELESSLAQLAKKYASVPMLSHTHGQPASPTTMGKELANFHFRLNKWREDLAATEIYGKFNGAVGNFNAHVVASKSTDWRVVSDSFVLGLGLQTNPMTTQIEPHDYIARYCNAIFGYNVALIDLTRDIWSYISMDYFKLKLVSGEVGSSTMPHKINPIDFENAEGNLGIANSLFHHFSEKLPVSRLQRDLSDSTVQRNFGTAIGHALVAFTSINRGLSKLELNVEGICEDLTDTWEILGEAVQTVLRVEGVENGYELIKSLTRGQRLDRESYLKIIEQLPLSDASREKLAELTPETYVGLAAELTNQYT